VSGHDIAAIDDALSRVPFSNGRPTCIVAHTIKGKGVSFMEDTVLWHYRSPQGDELNRAIAELESKRP
jgi:transketolase